MRMFFFYKLTHVKSFRLYYNTDTEVIVNFLQFNNNKYSSKRVILINGFIKTILYFIFRKRMSLV